MILNQSSYEFIFKGLLTGFIISLLLGQLQKMGYSRFYLYDVQNLNDNTGLHHLKGEDASIRIWGPFGNSLTFSQYLSISGLMLYGYFKLIKRNNLFAIVILLLTFYGIVLTVARTALIATALCVFIFEMINSKSKGKKIQSIVIISVMFLGFIFLSMLNGTSAKIPILDRFLNSEGDFKAGRLTLWIDGIQIFTKNIFLGVGPGNLFLALSEEGYPMTSKLINQFDGQHVENYYLTIFCTYGILGFITIFVLFYYLVYYSYVLFKFIKTYMLENTNIVYFGAIMLCPILSLIINNFTNPALIFDSKIKLLYIFILAITNNAYTYFNQIRIHKVPDNMVLNPIQ